ncbi:hypothetical protein EMEDMD4_1310089 [Sinorhizobium medicae]|uniref:Uncharacterized protein n=1 Tax=Sinorhizobium medicae TaxID=110321 RepID=A0A508WRF8_9HYPH|nr:hypothetical protein EMEDMD4_1310089 [Sinorhizobium medicae]
MQADRQQLGHHERSRPSRLRPNSGAALPVVAGPGRRSPGRGPRRVPSPADTAFGALPQNRQLSPRVRDFLDWVLKLLSEADL